MRPLRYVPVLLAIVAMSLSCTSRNGSSIEEGEPLYTPDYASGFSITAYGKSSILSIKNPWQGARDVEMKLFLSRNGQTPPKGFDGIVAEAPLRKLVCMSSSYIAFMDAIGEIDAVKGVSGARYISNDTIRARFVRGEVRDVGYDNHLNYELITLLQPDLVLAYGVADENTALSRKLSELGIKILYIGDYVEQSPLGKAEWIVAFGEMFDKRAEAEEYFAGVCESYLKTKVLIGKSTSHDYDEPGQQEAPLNKPLVMLNAPYRDTWFVPGDSSYMVRLIEDAGGRYACQGDQSERSRPISAESAYIYLNKSEVWLNPGQVTSMVELKSLYPRFADTPPVISGRVFNCNLRTTPEGGSDFWESGAVRPDIVLRDIVSMLHPRQVPGYEPYYFRHIK